jgi:hypothetical protein
MGSGPLNDYGRALFATEITANSSNASEEQLSDESGFLGATEIPWWIRPGAKFRGLFLKNKLENSENSVNRFIPMQANLNAALLLDKKGDNMIVASFDYAPTPARFKSSTERPPANWLSKEHYYRWQMQKGLLLYLGLMDKPFGIRHPDHTAFNRGFNGFGLSQNDQSHGALLQYSTDGVDVFFNLFGGNLSQDADLRQKGFSLMTEYATSKNAVVGFSYLQSKNEYLDMTRTSAHTRVGFAKGKSVMAELGLRKDVPLQIADPTVTGAFFYMQSLIAMDRGYNLMTTYQMYKDELASSGVTRNKLGLGALMFPWKKTEIRTEILNDRTVAEQNSTDDTWTFQSQVHFSW